MRDAHFNRRFKRFAWFPVRTAQGWVWLDVVIVTETVLGPRYEAAR